MNEATAQVKREYRAWRRSLRDNRERLMGGFAQFLAERDGHGVIFELNQLPTTGQPASTTTITRRKK